MVICYVSLVFTHSSVVSSKATQHDDPMAVAVHLLQNKYQILLIFLKLMTGRFVPREVVVTLQWCPKLLFFSNGIMSCLHFAGAEGNYDTWNLKTWGFLRCKEQWMTCSLRICRENVFWGFSFFFLLIILARNYMYRSSTRTVSYTWSEVK